MSLQRKNLRMRMETSKGLLMDSENRGLRSETFGASAAQIKKLYYGKVIDSLYPNKGIVEAQEGLFEVKGAIPGQTVSFLVKRRRRSRGEGRLVEILEMSPDEIESKCPHFRICGGCLYQSLDYEKEVSLKRDQIERLFKNVEKNNPGRFSGGWYEGIIKSPLDRHYRGKMEYSFGNMEIGGPLTLGMHTPGHFNDVVTVDGCEIADSDFNIILKKCLEFFKERAVSFRRKATGEGVLRHLVLRKGHRTGEILACLVTTSEAREIGLYEGQPMMDEFLKDLVSLPLSGEIRGILHEINDSPADTVPGTNYKVLYGRDYFYEAMNGLRFKVGMFSFLQTNPLCAELLYDKAVSYAQELFEGDASGIILDLYSGTGTISQIIASRLRDRKVLGVELDGEAVNCARENAIANGISNAEFIAGDVFKTLESLEERAGLIILDPPRDGASAKALNKILSFEVPGFVYVSCKPTSLARDMGQIFEAGYQLSKLCAVDMFPGTANVETVALFRRGTVQ